jgi:hypothetical protein
MVAFTGLLIVACGGSSSSAAKAVEVHSPTPSPSPTPSNIAKVDACSLVHQDEATSLVGTPVANLATSQGAQIPGLCFYATPDSKTSVVIFGQVFPDSATASGFTPEQIAAAINSGNALSTATPVVGIGDKAVEYTFTSGQGNGLAIVVFKSNVLFVIAVTPAPSSAKALEDLARTAAGRL